MIRSMIGQLSTDSTRMIWATPGPGRKLMMTMPARIAGIPIATSVALATRLSTMPPKKPASEPSTTAKMPDRTGTARPTVIDTRVP